MVEEQPITETLSRGKPTSIYKDTGGTELTESQWVDLQSWSSEKKRKWNQEGYEKEERRKRFCTEKEKGVEKDDEVNKAISRSVTFARDGDYLEAARALNNKPLLDPLHPITIKLMEELENAAESDMDGSQEILPKSFY